MKERSPVSTGEGGSLAASMAGGVAMAAESPRMREQAGLIARFRLDARAATTPSTAPPVEPMQFVGKGRLNAAHFEAVKQSVVDGLTEETDKESAGGDWPQNTFHRSAGGRLATPAHDASGWGMLVRADVLDEHKANLEGRNFPETAWQSPQQTARFHGQTTTGPDYRLVRPMDSTKAGAPALTPTDCGQQCNRAAGIVSPVIHVPGAGTVPDEIDANDPFLAKIDVLALALQGKYDLADLQALRAAYVGTGAKADQQALDKLLLRRYEALGDDEREQIDATYGLNRHARSDVGQAFVTVSDTETQTKNFAFHAGGVVDSDGDDVVTWENFANWSQAYGKGTSETNPFAVFKMYSNDPTSGQTFHDIIAKGGVIGGSDKARQDDALLEYGRTPITIATRSRRPVATAVQPGASMLGANLASSSSNPPYGSGGAYMPNYGVYPGMPMNGPAYGVNTNYSSSSGPHVPNRGFPSYDPYSGGTTYLPTHGANTTSSSSSSFHVPGGSFMSSPGSDPYVATHAANTTSSSHSPHRPDEARLEPSLFDDVDFSSYALGEDEEFTADFPGNIEADPTWFSTLATNAGANTTSSSSGSHPMPSAVAFEPEARGEEADDESWRIFLADDDAGPPTKKAKHSHEEKKEDDEQ